MFPGKRAVGSIPCFEAEFYGKTSDVSLNQCIDSIFGELDSISEQVNRFERKSKFVCRRTHVDVKRRCSSAHNSMSIPNCCYNCLRFNTSESAQRRKKRKEKEKKKSIDDSWKSFIFHLFPRRRKFTFLSQLRTLLFLSVNYERLAGNDKPRMRMLLLQISKEKNKRSAHILLDHRLPAIHGGEYRTGSADAWDNCTCACFLSCTITRHWPLYEASLIHSSLLPSSGIFFAATRCRFLALAHWHHSTRDEPSPSPLRIACAARTCYVAARQMRRVAR